MADRRYFGLVLCCAAASAFAAPVAVHARTAPLPAVEPQSGKEVDTLLDSIVECGAIVENDKRLACFDAQLVKLKTVKKVGKPLFPERGESERRVFKEINSRAVSVTELGGSWLIVLADHSVWRTVDIVRFEPKVGDSVVVKKGALGSFKAAIGDQHEVRVRRLD